MTAALADSLSTLMPPHSSPFTVFFKPVSTCLEVIVLSASPSQKLCCQDLPLLPSGLFCVPLPRKVFSTLSDLYSPLLHVPHLLSLFRKKQPSSGVAPSLTISTVTVCHPLLPMPYQKRGWPCLGTVWDIYCLVTLWDILHLRILWDIPRLGTLWDIPRLDTLWSSPLGSICP